METLLVKLKNFLIIYLLGLFGVHKFLGGNKKWGFIYLFTFGLFGLGWIYDLFACLFYPGDYIHKKPLKQEQKGLRGQQLNQNIPSKTDSQLNNYNVASIVREQMRRMDEKVEYVKYNTSDNLNSENKADEKVANITVPERVDNYALEEVIEKEMSYSKVLPIKVSKLGTIFDPSLVAQKGDELYFTIEKYIDDPQYKVRAYTRKLTADTATIDFLVYKRFEFSDDIKIIDEDYSLVYLNTSERVKGAMYTKPGNELVLDYFNDDRITVTDRKIGYELGDISKKESKKIEEYLYEDDYIIKSTLKSCKQRTDYHPAEIIVNVKIYDFNKYLYPKTQKKEEDFCNAIVERAILEKNAMGMFETENHNHEYTVLLYENKEILKVSCNRRNKWIKVMMPKSLVEKYKDNTLFNVQKNSPYWQMNFDENSTVEIQDIILDCFVVLKGVGYE